MRLAPAISFVLGKIALNEARGSYTAKRDVAAFETILKSIEASYPEHYAEGVEIYQRHLERLADREPSSPDDGSNLDHVE